MVFNPYWTLTPSIAANETLPKLKKDPHYLKEKNMRLFPGWGDNSPELDATTINWSKVSKKGMNQYRIRQDPGPDNALGTLKLIFPNKYHVYLHDTPTHGLFKQERLLEKESGFYVISQGHFKRHSFFKPVADNASHRLNRALSR